jgi:hypothetical protein
MLIAITMVHNEMPLLPLTLANLLIQGVDRILIADHNSTDDTLTWLRCAERADGRITVMAHHTPAWNQEAVISSLARIATALGATWILPFDADEFWIATDPSLRLSDALDSATPSGVEAIAVRLQNFAAPFDCDDFHLSDLPRFTHRFAATAPPFTDDLSAFQHGLRAFASCAYPDKFIVRATPNVLVGAGAHTVPSIIGTVVDEVSQDVRCLHVPLRSRRFIAARIAQGQMIKSSGLPSWWGWQNQMLVSLDPERDLDPIWAVNSYADTGHSAEAATNEVFIPDATLAELYTKLSTHPLMDPTVKSGGPGGEAQHDLSTAWLAITERLMLEEQSSNKERLAALNIAEEERSATIAAHDQLERERAGRMAVERDLDDERAQRLAVERHLDDERAQRVAEVARLGTEMAEHEAQATLMEAEASRQDAQIERLEGSVRTLADRAAARAAADAARAAVDAAAFAQLNWEMDFIKASRGWRALEIMRRPYRLMRRLGRALRHPAPFRRRSP